METINSQDFERLEQMRQMEELKKQILGKILTRDAYERLSRVRIVNPALAGQAELYLLQIYQQGKLQDHVTDGQMRDVLRAVSAKKEITIKRR